MDLLSIGAFAALTRLTPKALRLYADLDLLRPAHVDSATGYRFYAPSQLERARMVAWLRRLGMPLATIRAVCDLEPADAAAAIRRYWAQVEAETAARRDLADFLVAELGTVPSHATGGTGVPLTLRSAVLSDRGHVRRHNQDAVYAGDRLIAVADGFGIGGERAGTAAIDTLRALAESTSDVDSRAVLRDAVARANHAIAALPRPPADDRGAPVGTTLTALLWTGSRVTLVHIGDTRAYRLRGGRLRRITRDHTLVQHLVDDGRLNPDEIASHPQRTLLLRALDGRAGPAADLGRPEARPGDRYLLCSDGLTAVVSDPVISRVLRTAAEPDTAVHDLVRLARNAGAPDNVSCVVTDTGC